MLVEECLSQTIAQTNEAKGTGISSSFPQEEPLPDMWTHGKASQQHR